MHEVIFLGHKCTDKGVLSDAKKYEVIKNYPVPHDADSASWLLLQYPDFRKNFCIITDASKQTCGGVLTQNRNGIQLPIAYASRSFTKGESKRAQHNKS